MTDDINVIEAALRAMATEYRRAAIDLHLADPEDHESWRQFNRIDKRIIRNATKLGGDQFDQLDQVAQTVISYAEASIKLNKGKQRSSFAMRNVRDQLHAKLIRIAPRS